MTATATGHPITVVMRARELAEAHFAPAEIVELLARDGVTVSSRSIRRWTNPHTRRLDELRKLQIIARESRAAGARPMGSPNARPEYKIARMIALRDLGVSLGAIAKIMAFDFGDDITDDQVRYAVRIGSYPSRFRAGD